MAEEKPIVSDSIPRMDELRQLDANYRSFPSFESWSSCGIDQARWDRYTSRIDRNVSPERLKRALNLVKRAAAIDTGAIEGLYDVDAGFTISVATEAAMWETALAAKGDRVRALFEAQLRGYDRVLDFATQQVPIAEAWLRELHAEITAPQETYLVATEVGPQEQALPHGEYKHHANHVRQADGTFHSYAPVDLVPEEMHRLCTTLRSTEFLEAHPVIQAAYAHYALVAIHPFADGNGRAARALASVFTCRSSSVVLLVLADRRAEYRSALRAADKGSHQPFTDFMFSAAIDALQMVEQSITAAKAQDASLARAQIAALYKTRGGFSHEDVEQAAANFFSAVQTEFTRKATELAQPPKLQIAVAVQHQQGSLAGLPEYRFLETARVITVQCSTARPAAANVGEMVQIEVPRDCGKEDDLLIRGHHFSLAARVEDLNPITLAVTMRIRIVVDGLFAQLLSDLAAAAEKALRGR